MVPVLAAAVPDVALALTSVSDEGRMSVNSSVALSGCAPMPLLVIVTVYVTSLPTSKVPEAVLVASRSAGVNASGALQTAGMMFTVKALMLPVS